MLWNPRVLPLDDLFVKALHVVCPEWRNEGTHFVEDAPQRPDIALGVIWHVSPNLGACVIRCSCLCVTEAFLHNFRNIQIAKFRLHIPIQENVSRLHVSVQYFSIVQSFKTSHNLDKYVPYFLLLDICLSFLVAANLLENVAIVGVFHYEAR
jgi:hypothetical protein